MFLIILAVMVAAALGFYYNTGPDERVDADKGEARSPAIPASTRSLTRQAGRAASRYVRRPPKPPRPRIPRLR